MRRCGFGTMFAIFVFLLISFLRNGNPLNLSKCLRPPNIENQTIANRPSKFLKNCSATRLAQWALEIDCTYSQSVQNKLFATSRMKQVSCFNFERVGGTLWHANCNTTGIVLNLFKVLTIQLFRLIFRCNWVTNWSFVNEVRNRLHDTSEVLSPAHVLITGRHVTSLQSILSH